MKLECVGLWHRGHFEINLLHKLCDVKHGAGKPVQLGYQQLSVVLFARCQSFYTFWTILKGELAAHHIHILTNDVPAVCVCSTFNVVTLCIQAQARITLALGGNSDVTDNINHGDALTGFVVCEDILPTTTTNYQLGRRSS